MTKMDATKARADFSDTLNRVAYGGKRILLLRRGRPVAAMVTPEDLERLEALGHAKTRKGKTHAED
ncbi:MAG: type II toxin-antitoxin system Phd/YefM family antitoxin [Planctomycetes bacterium]|nr:type II toxin-antitoxin system Phd/YefM family antitoxin [Planctomycetota bacterium]